MIANISEHKNRYEETASSPDQASISFRSFESALKMILKYQKDPERNAIVQKVYSKFMETGDPAVCTQLDADSQGMLKKIRSHLKYFKLAFIELTFRNRQYIKYENSNIVDHLLSIQDNLDFEDLKKSYSEELLNLKQKFCWSEKFIKEWVERALTMQENQEEPFKKKEVKQTVSTAKISFKRESTVKAEVETQVGQEPVKKIKKDSLNQKALIASMKCVINHSEGQIKENLQQKLKKYEETSNLQYLQLLGCEIDKRLFELRFYIRIVMDAFAQLTTMPQFSQFADKQMVHKILADQEIIDLSNIEGSYRRILEQKQVQNNWSELFVQTLIKKVLEIKQRQIQALQKR